MAVLRSVKGPTQAHPHCLSCNVYEEDGSEESILYLERWDSDSDFERHVRSDLYRRVLSAMDLSRKAPEIAFDYAPTTQGIELIEKLRTESQPT